MTVASVGFQCPECIADGRKTVREPRTVFGGRVQEQVNRITLVLLGLNVALYVLQVASAGEVTDRFAMIGYLEGADIGVAAGEYYRLLTAAFLHGSPIHLLFNMVALFMVGPQIEAALGRGRYLTLYLLSALGGSAASYLISSPFQRGVGASGAVFGLFAAYFVITRRLGGDTSQITGLLGINLVIGFVIPGIDWRAHLGGLVVGGLLAAAYTYRPPKAGRIPLAAAASAGVAVACAAIVVLRTSALVG